MNNLSELYKEYSDLTNDRPINFEKFNNYAIVHHSTGIEGSTLTQEETFLLLDEHLTPKGKPIEHSLMSLDHLDALIFTLKLAEEQRDIHIVDIQRIGSLVMKNTGGKISSMAGEFDTSRGEFRKNTVRVGNRMFMNYQKVPQQMQELLDFVNSSLKTIDKNDINAVYELAFKAHFQMVSIHPFADGNGRSSRLLMNYIQAFCHKPLTIIFKEDKLEYFTALETTRKEENINLFVDFMNKQAIKFLQQEINAFRTPKEQKKGTGFTFLF